MGGYVRFILVLLILLCAGPFASEAAEPTRDQIIHFLNRISYGPAPGDIETAQQVGLEVYLAQQLHPETLRTPADLTEHLDDLKTIHMSLAEMTERYAVPLEEAAHNKDEDAARDARRAAEDIVNDMIRGRMLRAAKSPAQLQEVMTDFWYNHFNVSVDKGLDRIWIGSYERDAIRPHALGRFRDLLEATARHPAMLEYLDNLHNVAPTGPDKNGKRQGINENYAREIMELHTLGAGGGYTQQDVTQLAYILTGWGVDHNTRSTFFFDPKRHAGGDKVLLGNVIKGGGAEEIETALDLLARHPSTAKHLSYQLAQYFVADDPPPALVQRMSDVYLKTDGDIAAVLNALFHSPEFWDPKTYNNKFKSPWHYVASIMRATGIESDEEMDLWNNTLKQLGEPLYRFATPNGYPNTNNFWLSSDGLLKRIDITRNFVNQREKEGTPLQAVGLIHTLGDNFDPESLNAIARAPLKLQPALVLSSPEFLYY